ncbi:hypothetical protein SAT01_16650 [Sinomonas atrocyanea]|nr:hypothetical protein SAT01_16650 [Sinomonas atrocyanea]GGG57325.1 hypothetical protein GCM10007172_05250 [Sinomonas atrocyanea]
MPNPLVPFVDPRFTERLRRGRTWVGVLSLVVGAFALIGTAATAVLASLRPGLITSGLVGAVLVAFGLMEGLAYLGVGIWVLVTRRGTTSAPIITAVVLSSIGVALGLFDVLTEALSGRSLQVWALVVVAILLGRSIRVLRMKPSPAQFPPPTRAG